MPKIFMKYPGSSGQKQGQKPLWCVGPTALAAKDDAYLSAHEAGSFLPNFGLGPERTEHHGPNRYRLAGEWGKSMA